VYRELWLGACYLALFCALSCPALCAQSASIYASIAGTVNDRTGAAVLDASVTVTNENTNIGGRVNTDEEGFYRVERLIQGVYHAKVDGMEVLREIKKDPRTRAIPVVILTASRDESDMANGYHFGANGYVQKPVDFDKLRNLVKQLGLYWLVVNEHPPPAAFQAK